VLFRSGRRGRDGFAAASSQYPGCGNDCDDADPETSPGAFEGCGADPADPSACPGCPPEDFDRTDDDCDGGIDEGCFSDDLDGDGVPSATDCNDCNAAIGPELDERCGDGVDQDCSGSDLPCSPDDADGDGVTAAAGDCDDTDARTYPEAPDHCGDGIAQDCALDRACRAIIDADGDSFAAGAGDCDDANANVGPWGDEVCDAAGIDEDCDGAINEVDGATSLEAGCVLRAGAWSMIDFESDVEHCGGCRQSCCTSACDCRGDACVDGTCTCGGSAECAGGATSFCCPGVGCRDLSADVENCGACGLRCAQSETCVPGDGCGLGRCE
jgi:hypothetical protein